MTEPTDAEIIAVMRDGYNCRYNDEADHIDFAHAVLAKWGAQPVPTSAAEFALQALVAAGHVTQERVDQAMALPGAPAQPVALELPAPWGHCVSGRIFVGRLPEHARKLAEAESLRIQPLYTEQQVRELVAAPQPVVREPLTDEQIESAAKVLAASFDYPWDHMPEKGRETMRGNVRAVIDAATAKP